MQKKTFVQAEPVPIGVEIRNRSEKDVEVIPALEPEDLMLRFRVTDPEGETCIPRPLTVVFGVQPEKIVLGPGDKLAYTAPLVFGKVDRVAKFIFTRTGEYRVQALFKPDVPGKEIFSEPITITVVEAQGVDRQAQRLFMGEEQGRFAAGSGDSQAAMDSFQRILREYPTSRFAPYAAYYLGLYYQRHRDYKQSIELFEHILKDYKDFPVWADVMYQLAIAYRETGRKDKASECISQLISKEPSHLRARSGKELLREL